MNQSQARADEVIRLLEDRGGAAYFGESVSQREHALQAAHLAREAGSSPVLVAAALLHDVGHLLNHGDTHHGDARHEEDGYRWLLDRYGTAIAEPVRLHVAAKRYLCSVEPEYFAQLSPASVESLALQGGAFTAEEAREFEEVPYYRDAVQLRRWDDLAKAPGCDVPGLEEYRAILCALAR